GPEPVDQIAEKWRKARGDQRGGRQSRRKQGSAPAEFLSHRLHEHVHRSGDDAQVREAEKARQDQRPAARPLGFSGLTSLVRQRSLPPYFARALFPGSTTLPTPFRLSG